MFTINLDDYRKQIDDIDKEIIELFAKRMYMAGNIAQYKKDNNLNITQTGREEEVLKKVCSQSPDELVPYTKILFNTLINLSKKYQEEKLNTK